MPGLHRFILQCFGQKKDRSIFSLFGAGPLFLSLYGTVWEKNGHGSRRGAGASRWMARKERKGKTKGGKAAALRIRERRVADYCGLFEAMAVIVTVRSPAGRLISTSSSTFLPSSALPTGESTLIFPRLTSNSSGPTSW